MRPIIVVHGGAGEIPKSRIPLKLSGVRAAAKAGYAILTERQSPAGLNSTALDACVKAIGVLEDLEGFNAGFGSMLNVEGGIEMDAAVMEAKLSRYGAVAAIKNVKNPIEVAQKVLQKSPHSLIAGEGATKFAREHGFEFISDKELTSEYALRALKAGSTVINELGDETDENSRGTVGAVAIDEDGNLAAATSTGGINGQYVGRVGDSPIIGAGLYADDVHGTAVSTTGQGDLMLRFLTAQRISGLIAEGEMSASESVQKVFDDMSDALGGDGGAIVVTKSGRIGIGWNSLRMSWAFIEEGKMHSGIEKGDDFVEPV